MQNKVISCKCGADKIFTETQKGLICVCGIGCYNIDCKYSGSLTYGFGFTEKRVKKRTWPMHLHKKKNICLFCAYFV